MPTRVAAVRTPDFFIVGAPKCGTTALYEYLRQHPDVFLPETKEIPYFGTDLLLKPRCTPEAFRAHFADAQDQTRVGAAWVLYLCSKVAAKEIHDYERDARILIMLRNPVDMIHSLHSHLLYSAREDLEEFAEALDAEEDRKRGRELPAMARTGEYPIEVLFYREQANYAPGVLRYLEVFGSERVHVILYDDFVADTPRAYREALRFLGVDDGFAPEFPVIHSNKRARSRRLQRLISYPPRPVRAVARILLTPQARVKVRELNTSVEPRQPMDPGLRRALIAEFAPDVRRLADLLGRDLSAWTRA